MIVEQEPAGQDAGIEPFVFDSRTAYTSDEECVDQVGAEVLPRLPRGDRPPDTVQDRFR